MNDIRGEDLEKEGRLVEAKEYYWGLINNGFHGSRPFRRLRVIYSKEKDWENAAKICEMYANIGRKLGGGNYEMKKLKMEEWAQKYRKYLRSDTKLPSGADIIYNLINNKDIQKKCALNNQIKLKDNYNYDIEDIFPIGPENIVRNNKQQIPEFHAFDYSKENELPHDILIYYDYWLELWKKREALDLRGNDGYIIKFITDKKKELIYSNRKVVAQVRYELKLLKYVYGNESYPRYDGLLIFYLPWDILYTYLIPKQDILGIQYIEGCYEELFKVNTPARIDLLNLVLSAKYKNKLSISGIELYELAKRQISKHNISKIIPREAIIYYLNEKIQLFEIESNLNLLSLITQNCVLDTTHPFGSKMVYWKIYNYKSVGSIGVVLKEWLEEAENKARDQNELPRIGKGWVSETYLYNIICSYFKEKGCEVIHHARPPFLVRQELDIYIPAIKLGIEYQGIQHYKPIMLFGGKEGLKYRKILDERKKELCDKSGIKLIEFSYDEPLNDNYVFDKLRKEGF